jgi:hypothetical protein
MNLIKNLQFRIHILKLTLVLFSFCGMNAYAVSNQELMDRLDDIESAQQQREMNRLMDEYTRIMTQPQSHSKALPKSQTSNGNCAVFYDGLKFQLGKTESKNYERFAVPFHNYGELEFAIPKENFKKLKALNYGQRDELIAEKFMGNNWHRIAEICGRK